MAAVASIVTAYKNYVRKPWDAVSSLAPAAVILLAAAAAYHFYRSQFLCLEPVAWIAIAIVAGFFAGGYQLRLSTKWLSKKYDLGLDETRFTGLAESGGWYLSIICVLFIFYLWGYSQVLLGIDHAGTDAPKDKQQRSLDHSNHAKPAAAPGLPWVIPDALAPPKATPVPTTAKENTPIPPMVFVMNAAAALGMAYAAARYTAFVRLLALFDFLLLPGNRSLRNVLLPKVSERVHREETWFEPPGNIFVTIGLASTFMGLAAALGSMDISHFLALHKPDATPAEAQAATDGAMRELTIFLRCMSLGLGMSMLGVLVAITAQRFRGISGPATTTDELLETCYSARKELATSDKAALEIDVAVSTMADSLAQAVGALSAASKIVAENARNGAFDPKGVERQLSKLNEHIDECNKTAINVVSELGSAKSALIAAVSTRSA